MRKEIPVKGTIVIETKERAGLECGDPSWGYTECYVLFNDTIITFYNDTSDNHVKSATAWVEDLAKRIEGANDG